MGKGKEKKVRKQEKGTKKKQKGKNRIEKRGNGKKGSENNIKIKVTKKTDRKESKK